MKEFPFIRMLFSTFFMIFYFISDYQPARNAITESGISPFT